MAFYKFLYDNGYLKGAKKESSITLKGAQKLSSFFEASFNFISIEIISEDKYFKEFDIFKTISEKFIKNKTDSPSKINEENNYSSAQEDGLFSELKKFNQKFKEISPNSLEDFPKNDKLIFSELYKFYGKREQIINNLICKKILNSQKKAILNFYIWVDQKNDHYSTVVNIDNYYIFLDSCSVYFKRWPNRSLISKNDNDRLFNKYKTLVMLSFLQADEFNCVSFAFAFVEIFIELYQKYNKQKLINYLFEYFNLLWYGLFITESNSFSIDYIEPQIFYLPEEILLLAQSLRKLKYLLAEAKESKKENEIVTINKVINEIKNEKKITKYRIFHLDCLMESIQNDLFLQDKI